MSRLPYVRSLARMILILNLAAIAPVTGYASSDMATQLLAGSPWQMTMANGRSGRLTLHEDGSGTMNVGPMRMGLTWSALADDFCMNTRRMGQRCVTLTEDDGGFTGVDQDGQPFRLSK